ncbi:MAG: SURF1 family protein [Ilumatobacteraceae bacterium]|nr:SURF1 family protein [Ilumatobacteraceae bacterium]
MYRFLLRPRWIAFHVLCLAAVVAMVNLGLWQLDRLDARREFNAVVEARFDQPPLPLDELLASGSPDEVEWRPATVSGVYEPEGQILVVNRSQNGRAGDNVVTPLVLADGRVVLVNRGFVPLGTDAPPPPDGEVSVVGRVRPAEERRRGQLTDATEGRLTEVQRIDLDRLAPQLPGEPVPAYLDLIESTPPEPEGLPEALPVPDLSEGPHLSYAVQWFIFATCVVVGWVLAVRHSVRQRRRGAPLSATPPTADPGGAAHEPATAPSGTPSP